MAATHAHRKYTLRARMGLAMVAAIPKASSVAHSFAELGGFFDRGLVR
jgi:hypothetical protein